MKKFKIFVIITFITFLTVFIFKDKLLFEYYIWNLSSEERTEREIYSEKIINLGNNAVPLLIKKLDEPFIYETEMIDKCLEEITGVRDTLPSNYENIRKFWNNWRKQNP